MPEDGFDQALLEIEIREKLQKEYEEETKDSAGRLHNRISGYISEEKPPLELVLLVIDMIREEIIDVCRREYLGV